MRNSSTVSLPTQGYIILKCIIQINWEAKSFGSHFVTSALPRQALITDTYTYLSDLCECLLGAWQHLETQENRGQARSCATGIQLGQRT